MSERREYELKLTVVSPFLFKGVTNTRLGVDAAFLRDESGNPVIPADQIRGVLRAALSQMVDRGYPGVALIDLFGMESEKVPVAGRHDEPQRGALIFSDLVGSVEEAGEFTRIAIDDFTGAVARGALQVIELASKPGAKSIFTGTLILRLADAKKADAAEVALRKSLKLILSIGAIKSAGFGAVEAGGSSLALVSREALAPAKIAAPANKPVVYDVTFDRPILVDAQRVTENMFAGAKIVPGAAFKGAVAERLHRAGLDPRNRPDVSQALAAVRFSHAFPLVDGKRAARALPLSLVMKDPKDFGLADISSWDFDDGPLRIGGSAAADFLVSAKDPEKKAARQSLGMPAFDPAVLARTHVAIDENDLVAEDEKLFSTVLVATKGHAWRLSVDFGAVADPAMAALIAGAIGGRIDGIGRTGATATLTQTGDAPLPTVSGNGATLVLETPALLFDGAIADLAMRKRYEDYFHTRLGGAKLANFFARRRMAGGYQATRHRAYGGAYYPFVLTEPGSVFRLDLPDQKARDAVNKALRFGLPAADLDGKAVDWRNCPYLPQNGYGEVSLGVAGGLTDAGVKKVRAADVR